MEPNYADEQGFNGLTKEEKQKVEELRKAQTKQDDMKPLKIKHYNVDLLDVYHLCLGCQETEESNNWCNGRRFESVFGLTFLICVLLSPALFWEFY